MNFVALTKYIALFEDGEAVHEFLGLIKMKENEEYCVWF